MSLFLRLQECRLLGESNSKLCQRAGIAYRQFLDMQHGGLPRTSTLESMASKLNVSILWFQEGIGPKDPSEFKKMIDAWVKKKRNAKPPWESHKVLT